MGAQAMTKPTDEPEFPERLYLEKALDDEPITQDDVQEVVRRLDIDIGAWSSEIRRRVAAASEADRRQGDMTMTTQTQTPTTHEVLSYINDTYTGMTRHEIDAAVRFARSQVEDWTTQLDAYVAAKEAYVDGVQRRARERR